MRRYEPGRNRTCPHASEISILFLSEANPTHVSTHTFEALQRYAMRRYEVSQRHIEPRLFHPFQAHLGTHIPSCMTILGPHGVPFCAPGSDPAEGRGRTGVALASRIFLACSGSVTRPDSAKNRRLSLAWFRLAWFSSPTLIILRISSCCSLWLSSCKVPRLC